MSLGFVMVIDIMYYPLQIMRLHNGVHYDDYLVEGDEMGVDSLKFRRHTPFLLMYATYGIYTE